MLFQEVGELFAYHTVHGISRFTVAKLLLGLSLKLGILDLNADDSSHTLTDILAGQVRFFFL